MMRPEMRNKCASCHHAPQTPLHVQAGWKPATFDHARFFALTGPHKASCATCHVGGDG